jgi:hypothetical protein
MRNEAIEARGVEGLGLRVEFFWDGDRFGQLISTVSPNGEPQPILQSIEGSPADDWPASPPLQNLSIENLAGSRRAALLVGMAGQSHWSASVEAMPDKPELAFDLACRHATLPTWLGNRYRRLSDQASRVTIHGEDARVGESESIIAIEPAMALAPRGTSRWRFCIRTELIYRR